MTFGDFIGPIISGVAALAALVLIAWLNSQRRAQQRAETTGCIRPNRGTLWALIVLSMVIALAAGYGAYFNFTIFRISQFYPAALLCVVFLGATLFLVGYLSHEFEITWDDSGLTGPTSYWPWPFGPSPARMDYADIMDAGTDWADSFCIWNREGKKIRWSFLYSGYGQLLAQLERSRPELFEDFDGDSDSGWL